MEMISLSGPRMTESVLAAYRLFVDVMEGDDRRGGMDKAISSLARIDRFYVSERLEARVRPTLIAHRTESEISSRMTEYFDRFFQNDPVVRAMENATEDGHTVVLRVIPDDIEESDYRSHFFKQSNVIERVSFVQRLHNRWLIMNVARRAPLPRFSEEEVSSLAAFSQLLLPLASQHKATAQPVEPAYQLTIRDLEARFAHKFPALSPRERQVCARTVVGMTSEATALDLGVGIGSVQTYRKRAFHRLEICSAFQLAHLILH